MNKKITLGIVIGVLLIGTIGFTYSFFSTSITGEGQENIVTAGTLKLVYKDGDEVTLSNAKPGDSVSKTFTVSNTGTLTADYSINLSELINTITNDELVVSAVCKSYTEYETNKKLSEACSNIDEAIITNSSVSGAQTVKENISIKPGITHEYTITFTFKEMNTEQNYNQGKIFSTKVQINESTPSNRLVDRMLRDNTVNADNVASEYVTSSTGINFGEISSDTNGKGLYYTTNTNLTEDLNGDGKGERVYYYRGAVENNNVVFGEYINDEEYYKGYQSATSTRSFNYPTLEACQSAEYFNYNCEKVTVARKGKKMCWRIVRTNEDGSVRLRYNGVYENGTCPVTGTPLAINDVLFTFNLFSDNEKYNEYIWEDGTGESLAKTTIDAWYTSSGLVNYANQIANVPYCADKSNPTIGADGDTFYGAANRLTDINTSDFPPKSDAQPTYKCERTEDKHTVSGDNWGGNGKLTKPIALLTMDEVSFAGAVAFGKGVVSSASPYYNKTFYLYTGKSYSYYTMSPLNLTFITSTSVTPDASVGLVDGVLREGAMCNTSSGCQALLIPAISLKSTVTVNVNGDGSYTNPYVVEI